MYPRAFVITPLNKNRPMPIKNANKDGKAHVLKRAFKKISSLKNSLQ